MSKADELLEIKEPGPLKSAAQRLLGEIGEEPLTKLPVQVVINGQAITFQFRYPTDSGDTKAFESQAFEFIRKMADPVEIKGLLPSYRKALAIRELVPDDLVNAFIIHYWAHPDERIEEPEALSMVAINPTIVKALCDKIDEAHRNSAYFISFGGIVEKKNRFKEDRHEAIRLEAAILYGIGKHPDDMGAHEQEKLKDYMALVLYRRDMQIEDHNKMFGGKK